MNYPNKVKKSYNKNIIYGNRGMDLEKLINITNEYYLDNDIAVIYKKPTPIGIAKVSFENKKRTIEKSFFKTSSTLDYNGLYRGKYIDFDSKSSKNKTAFPLSNVHPHQLEHMKRIVNHGGITFLIIEMNGIIYLLLGEYLIEFITNNTRKSIPIEYLEEKGFKISYKINKPIDYLEIIDRLFF